MEISKTTQLYLPVPDEVGQLAKVMELIASAGINILAYAGYSQENGGHIIMVTEDNQRAEEILLEAGYQVRAQQAVLVKDTDELGHGAKLVKKLMEAGINLTGAYATASDGQYITIFQARDVDAIVSALE